MQLDVYPYVHQVALSVLRDSLNQPEIDRWAMVDARALNPFVYQVFNDFMIKVLLNENSSRNKAE